MARLAKVTHWLPITSMFGPAFMKDGPDQGVASHVVRLGSQGKSVSTNEILRGLATFQSAPWVKLAGNNLSALNLHDLIKSLQMSGFLVTVETGPKWREWMLKTDRMIVSLVPGDDPQRFMIEGLLYRRLNELPYHWLSMKVLVHTVEDLEWCETLRRQVSDAPLYLVSTDIKWLATEVKFRDILRTQDCILQCPLE